MPMTFMAFRVGRIPTEMALWHVGRMASKAVAPRVNKSSIFSAP